MAALGDKHLITWRNLVVAPVTEEFVFRACMAPLLMLQVSALTRTEDPVRTCMNYCVCDA
jgi:hypothetical protein